MASCHLTRQQNHPLQLQREIPRHFFLSPSSCLLSSMSCIQSGYKTPLAHSGEELGKQTNQNQTSPFPKDSKILEAAAPSNAPLGVTQKNTISIPYKHPLPSKRPASQSIPITNLISTSGKDLRLFPKLPLEENPSTLNVTRKVSKQQLCSCLQDGPKELDHVLDIGPQDTFTWEWFHQLGPNVC